MAMLHLSEQQNCVVCVKEEEEETQRIQDGDIMEEWQRSRTICGYVVYA
jgi:hypothetical protein